MRRLRFVALLLMPLVLRCTEAAPTEVSPVVPLSGATKCSSRWDDFAGPLFARSCSNCHMGQFLDVRKVAASAPQIQAAIASGKMPPTGLKSLERARLLEWFACGMPR